MAKTINGLIVQGLLFLGVLLLVLVVEERWGLYRIGEILNIIGTVGAFITAILVIKKVVEDLNMYEGIRGGFKDSENINPAGFIILWTVVGTVGLTTAFYTVIYMLVDSWVPNIDTISVGIIFFIIGFEMLDRVWKRRFKEEVDKRYKAHAEKAASTALPDAEAQ